MTENWTLSQVSPRARHGFETSQFTDIDFLVDQLSFHGEEILADTDSSLHSFVMAANVLQKTSKPMQSHDTRHIVDKHHCDTIMRLQTSSGPSAVSQECSSTVQAAQHTSSASEQSLMLIDSSSQTSNNSATKSTSEEVSKPSLENGLSNTNVQFADKRAHLPHEPDIYTDFADPAPLANLDASFSKPPNPVDEESSANDSDMLTALELSQMISIGAEGEYCVNVEAFLRRILPLAGDVNSDRLQSNVSYMATAIRGLSQLLSHEFSENFKLRQSSKSLQVHIDRLREDLADSIEECGYLKHCLARIERPDATKSNSDDDANWQRFLPKLADLRGFALHESARQNRQMKQHLRVLKTDYEALSDRLVVAQHASGTAHTKNLYTEIKRLNEQLVTEKAIFKAKLHDSTKQLDASFEQNGELEAQVAQLEYRVEQYQKSFDECEYALSKTKKRLEVVSDEKSKLQHKLNQAEEAIDSLYDSLAHKDSIIFRQTHELHSYRTADESLNRVEFSTVDLPEVTLGNSEYEQSGTNSSAKSMTTQLQGEIEYLRQQLKKAQAAATKNCRCRCTTTQSNHRNSLKLNICSNQISETVPTFNSTIIESKQNSARFPDSKHTEDPPTDYSMGPDEDRCPHSGGKSGSKFLQWLESEVVTDTSASQNVRTGAAIHHIENDATQNSISFKQSSNVLSSLQSDTDITTSWPPASAHVHTGTYKQNETSEISHILTSIREINEESMSFQQLSQIMQAWRIRAIKLAQFLPAISSTNLTTKTETAPSGLQFSIATIVENTSDTIAALWHQSSMKFQRLEKRFTRLQDRVQEILAFQTQYRSMRNDREKARARLNAFQTRQQMYCEAQRIANERINHFVQEASKISSFSVSASQSNWSDAERRLESQVRADQAAQQHNVQMTESERQCQQHTSDVNSTPQNVVQDETQRPTTPSEGHSSVSSGSSYMHLLDISNICFGSDTYGQSEIAQREIDKPNVEEASVGCIQADSTVTTVQDYVLPAISWNDNASAQESNPIKNEHDDIDEVLNLLEYALHK